MKQRLFITSVFLASLVCAMPMAAAVAENSNHCVKIAKYLISRRSFRTQPFDFSFPANAQATYFDRKPITSLVSLPESKALDDPKSELYRSELCWLAKYALGRIRFFRDDDLTIDKDRTEAALLDIIKSDREFAPLARFFLAESCRDRDPDRALKEFTLASEDPDLEKECLYWKASLFFKQRNRKECLRQIIELEKRPPFSCDTLRLSGDIHRAFGEFKKSLKMYRLLYKEWSELVSHSSEKYLLNHKLQQIADDINEIEKKLHQRSHAPEADTLQNP